MMGRYIKALRLSLNKYLKIIETVKMDSKLLAVGLLFGVGMALALKSWLLGIMFGIIFYVALNKLDKKEYSLSDEEE